ncbi:retrovirus-related pol polyprotein from transposon TNT 1-94 [Tanacetum coccineum]
MKGAKFDIKKFDGTGDFELWRIKMRALLIQHGCEAALEVFPTDMEAEAKVELNKKAHSAVIFCLGNKVLREVIGEITAAGVWTKLETLYMTKSLDNQLYLKNKLYTFCMPVGRKIFEYIDEFNKIVLDLANIEVKFENEDLALLLRTSLPASYEHFVDTLLYGREALTLEDMMATLNSKEIKERSKAKGDNGEGLYVRGRTGRRDSHQEFVQRIIARSQQVTSRNMISQAPVVQFLSVLRGSVLLGDNKECKIRGIGKVRVQLKDGSNFVLNNVRVVLSGKRKDNCVYFLDGHAMAGELKASIEENDSLALAWHKRLGCISEAGLQVESLGGKRYFLSIVDDYSKRVWVYILRFKHEAFEKFKEWKQLVENQTGRTLCTESGIARHLTVTGTPHQNKLVEHMNRTLIDKECCLLIQFGLPKTFWAEATCATAYLINRYPKGVKGYRLYRIDDESPKIVTSRKVVFNESVMYKDTLKDSGGDQEDGDDEDAGDQETDHTPDLTDYQLVRDREPRKRTKPLRFRDESNIAAYVFAAAEEEYTHEPLTYQEAVACEDNSKWKGAMKEEMGSLRKNNT